MHPGGGILIVPESFSHGNSSRKGLASALGLGRSNFRGPSQTPTPGNFYHRPVPRREKNGQKRVTTPSFPRRKLQRRIPLYRGVSLLKNTLPNLRKELQWEGGRKSKEEVKCALELKP